MVPCVAAIANDHAGVVVPTTADAALHGFEAHLRLLGDLHGLLNSGFVFHLISLTVDTVRRILELLDLAAFVARVSI